MCRAHGELQRQALKSVLLKSHKQSQLLGVLSSWFSRPYLNLRVYSSGCQSYCSSMSVLELNGV